MSPAKFFILPISPFASRLRPLAYLSWPIGKRRRRAFFLFFLALFLRGGLRRGAARERAGAGKEKREEKKQDHFPSYVAPQDPSIRAVSEGQ